MSSKDIAIPIIDKATKLKLSEADICTKLITPAIAYAGWDTVNQMRQEVAFREYFTDGQIMFDGKKTKRGDRKRADYLLYHKGRIKLAVVEAKRNKFLVSEGLQQALEYAQQLDVPFVYSSNGDSFREHDRTGNSKTPERDIPIDQFPSPQELWKRYCKWKGIDHGIEEVLTQSYHSADPNRKPRYYQEIAINRSVEAIAKGQDRAILVMATGTGKTYTAFQIIWRLWKAGVKKRILFLADRNILVDQTMTNDFKPFGGKMTKIKKRQIDKSYEVYLCLYQAVTGNEEDKNVYKQFSPDFFDLIVIDECHRGSAAIDSAWREILSYFGTATHLGLTATPKETKAVSNQDYFGEPIYTYSLKQGIQDGFLAPYKVIRYDLDRDLRGWRPEAGMLDKHGNEIADKEYARKDFDRTLVLEKRTELVAEKVSEYLGGTDPYSKTIVFCQDIDHAQRMRDFLVNLNPDMAAKSDRYVMRITGDNKEGKDQLENFCHPEQLFPVIACTSKLMTTGVDSKTCKVIVLDSNIESMTEFKQIIGRGTRLAEEFGKTHFTIIDFRGLSRHFADPAFDGDPEQVYEPAEGESMVPPEEEDEPAEVPHDDDVLEVELEHLTMGEIDGDEKTPRQKYFVDNVLVDVAFRTVAYYSHDGKLITESIRDYTRKKVNEHYRSLNDFVREWTEAERKDAIVQELIDHGIIFDALHEEVGQDFEAFDLILHVAFDQKPLTRKQRAEKVRRSNYLKKYSDQARKVLESLLDKYADAGIQEIEGLDVLNITPFDQFGTRIEIVKGIFGGKKRYIQALQELKNELYGSVA